MICHTFFFFLPSKACWALVLFAWRVQTLVHVIHLLLEKTVTTGCFPVQPHTLCSLGHFGSLLLKATSLVDNEREASAAPHPGPAPLTFRHCNHMNKHPSAASMHTHSIQEDIGCEPAYVQTWAFIPIESTRVHLFGYWEITRLPSCLQKASVSLTGHQVGWKLAPLLMAQSDGCGRQFHFVSPALMWKVWLQFIRRLTLGAIRGTSGRISPSDEKWAPLTFKLLCFFRLLHAVFSNNYSGSYLTGSHKCGGRCGQRLLLSCLFIKYKHIDNYSHSRESKSWSHKGNCSLHCWSH